MSDKVKAAGDYVISTEGEESGEWVLVDCGDMVVAHHAADHPGAVQPGRAVDAADAGETAEGREARQTSCKQKASERPPPEGCACRPQTGSQKPAAKTCRKKARQQKPTAKKPAAKPRQQPKTGRQSRREKPASTQTSPQKNPQQSLQPNPPANLPKAKNRQQEENRLSQLSRRLA